jgi:hypothetical protein
MTFRKHLIPSVLFILSGCSDPNEANIDTMQAAVQRGVDDINCQKIQDQRGNSKKLQIVHSKACESLEQMTKAGILNRITEKGYYNTDFIYTPSDEYLHEFKAHEENVMFCPGEPKVTKVTNFTIPAENNGMKISVVSFEWAVDLPQPIQKLYDAGVFRRGFSKSCALYDPFYTETILKGSSNMTVVLTNNGWQPAGK